MFRAVVKMASEEGVIARCAPEHEKRPTTLEEQSGFSLTHGKRKGAKKLHPTHLVFPFTLAPLG